jgi:hypothetical protein
MKDEDPPKLQELPRQKSSGDVSWGSAGKDARYLSKFRRLLAKTEEGDRKLLLSRRRGSGSLFPARRMLDPFQFLAPCCLS